MKILVAGLINIETTLKVDSFPIAYAPVHYPFFGVGSTVSGVGLNVSKALTFLGAEAPLLSIVGKDRFGQLSIDELEGCGVDASDVLPLIDETPQSVILYDADGRRQINVDLKDIQETPYPIDRFDRAAAGAVIACLCNINFARPLLSEAKRLGMKIATDLHVYSDLDDAYNRDYLAAADILFLSNEGIAGREADFMRTLVLGCGAEIICIGMGAEGVMLYSRADATIRRYRAVVTRKIVNTIGAGDSLFSAFIYFYSLNGDTDGAIRRALLFASWKIGVKGAADGFCSGNELESLFLRYGRDIESFII